jgi:uncharacterized Zn finger protein (UPF0148 family)
MPDLDTEVRAANACPACNSRLQEGDLFCARCGLFLRGENTSQEALNLPVVHLLTQVCRLQQELLRQFRTSQAMQARQFQRALEAQASQLEKTLAHAANHVDSQERRLYLTLRWGAGFAAALAGIVVFVQLI